MKVRSICLGPLATNAYLVEQDGVRILIDPAEASDRLMEFVGATPPDFVLNTHGHFDHVGGTWAFPGVPTAIHRSDLEMVDAFFPEHPTYDRWLTEDGDPVAGLTVLHTPGHSPGSVVFYAPGVLFAGDLLFAGSIGRTDLPGGSHPDMQASLRRLFALGEEFVVYPGHGEPTTLERERRYNPFVRGLLR